MKILVYAHVFEMGGTQVNAIELAQCLRDVYGHELILYASPGPMVKSRIVRDLAMAPSAVMLHERVAR